MQLSHNSPQNNVSALNDIREISGLQSSENLSPSGKNTNWFDNIPQEVKKLIAPYKYAPEADLKYANLDKLSRVFAEKEIRTEVISALQEAGPKLRENGERLALIYALLKTPGLEPAEVVNLVKQAGIFSRDKELYSLAGRVVEGMGQEVIREHAREIVSNSLPEFLGFKCYGADSTFSGWENSYACMNSREVTEFIYEELNERAIKGARSGYSHLINVLKKSDLEISGPVLERLVMETADPKKAHVPPLFIRMAAHEASALFRSAIFYAALSYFMGAEAFAGTTLPYAVFIIPHATQFIKFMKEQRNVNILAHAECMDTKINLAHQCIDLLMEKAKSSPQARDFLTLLSKMNFLDKKVSDYITVKE